MSYEFRSVCSQKISQIKAERAAEYAELMAIPKGQVIPAHLRALDADLRVLNICLAGFGSARESRIARKLVAV